MKNAFKELCGGVVVLKIKIGAVLLIILATLGFSETMAAQHAEEEEHTRRKTHGPSSSNAYINHLKKHKYINHAQLNGFRSRNYL